MTKTGKSITIDKESCISCGSCVAWCEHKALEMGEDGCPYVIEDSCVQCGGCIGVCPEYAIGYE